MTYFLFTIVGRCLRYPTLVLDPCPPTTRNLQLDNKTTWILGTTAVTRSQKPQNSIWFSSLLGLPRGWLAFSVHSPPPVSTIPISSTLTSHSVEGEYKTCSTVSLSFSTVSYSDSLRLSSCHPLSPLLPLFSYISFASSFLFFFFYFLQCSRFYLCASIRAVTNKRANVRRSLEIRDPPMCTRMRKDAIFCLGQRPASQSSVCRGCVEDDVRCARGPTTTTFRSTAGPVDDVLSTQCREIHRVRVTRTKEKKTWRKIDRGTPTTTTIHLSAKSMRSL